MVFSKLHRPLSLHSRTLLCLHQQQARNVNTAGKRSPSEYFTRTFWLGVALMVSSVALIKFDQSIEGPEGQPMITRLINKFHSREEIWEAKNAARTAMVERAARDRILFHNSPVRTVIEHRFPESFNSHSPNNHEAGWVGGNLDELRAHFDKQREDYVPPVLAAQRKRKAEEQKKKEEEQKK